MLKVKVSPASGSVTLGVTGALVVSSSVVMLALAAVGACAGGCPVMTPTMMAIRAAREISPSRNFLIAARIIVSIDRPPFYRRIRATDGMLLAGEGKSPTLGTAANCPQNWVRRRDRGNELMRCILCAGPDHRREDGRCFGAGSDRARGDGRGRPGYAGATCGLDLRAGFAATRGRIRDRRR